MYLLMSTTGGCAMIAVCRIFILDKIKNATRGDHQELIKCDIQNKNATHGDHQELIKCDIKNKNATHGDHDEFKH